MKPVSGKRMCKVLEDRGWTLLRIKGSHHTYRHPHQRRVIVIVPVHGNKHIPTGTQHGIMRDAGLTDQDL